MDIYEQLQRKLDEHPMGAPLRDSFLEILRILFTPDEAAVAEHLSFRPVRAESIAARAGLPVETVAERCEAMADKGIIYSAERNGRRYYMLLPTAPGLLEFPFMGHKKLDLPYPRLAKLWEDYYYDGFGQEMAGGRTHMGRVIPVHQTVSSDLQVLPYESVSQIIQDSGAIALADCTCRVAYHRCDRPIDVCLGFGTGAEFMAERRLGRLIGVDEAMNVLARSEEAGLVHCASNMREGVHFICNCCSCCCGLLGTVTKLHAPAEVLASAFAAAVDEGECTACGACEDRCPTHAITVGDTASVDPVRCLGCGLCTSACPAEAIRLQRKPEWPEPPRDYVEWAARMAEGKGRVH